MSSKTSINIRVLLNLDERLLKVGDITLNRLTGDIYYSPSSKQYLTDNLKKEDIIHFSWHKSGYKHLKQAEKSYKSLGRKGLQIKDIGYQELFRDLIIEPTKLTPFNKHTRANDVIFNLKEKKRAILFSLSIISGKLIVKRYKREDTPLNFRSVKNSEEVLGLEKRALGYESDNSDKLLQFLLVKATADSSKLRTKRRIIIIPNQNIANN